VTDARDAVQRLETFAAALQNQLNSLATDFVNRDDPIQRSGIAQKRDSVSAELERVKKDIAAKTKAISDIQNEARKAGVPAGWVR
jgi:gas vesicle protein